MRNVIFVESKNDIAFIEAIVNKINTPKPVCRFDEFFPYEETNIEELKGSGVNKLKNFVKFKVKEAILGQINKIAIVIDLDDFTILERLKFVNDAIQNAILEEIGQKTTSELTSENQLQLIDIQGNEIEIACYFMKIGKRGHLDTVLKEIADKNRSGYADCLATWQTCVEGKKLQYDQNQYEKFWVNTYINLDTCISSKHKGNKEKYCSMKNFDELIKKGIFNLDHECLNDLKIFLKLFN